MDSTFKDVEDVRKFLLNNRQSFEGKLLSEAVNVRDKIDEIHLIGNINLLTNAYKLILLVVDEKVDDVKEFAEQEGIVWAKYNLTLAFKIEWIQAIRRTLWHFLNQYDQINDKDRPNQEIYNMASKVNDLIDQFLNGFFISYSRYKDELIESQRKMVEKLSVPIIPITKTVSILPLIGTIDSYRANIIEEKILLEVGKLRIQKLILDLSGIAEMDTEAIHLFLKVLDGVSMMGSEVVITGMRPEIVRQMVELDINFGAKAKTKGSLQKALKEDLELEQSNKLNSLIPSEPLDTK
ncbi:STAS domain-containing protein [Ornithinibacillus halophilus]|uniref:Anti-anti-sigma factor n=1 Tax=Ornithinibacillus halophilus TaxID=930117 RepID=A0A1M5CCH2_9BACI|nr:STAS domain-containing protein [Ornithinibacillus halophilus]SHF52425.1 anti-anti-sigma factor [Ornithinibacillus halophilus]